MDITMADLVNPIPHSRGQSLSTLMSAKLDSLPRSNSDLSDSITDIDVSVRLQDQDVGVKQAPSNEPASAPWRFENVCIHTIEHVDAPHAVTSYSLMQRLGPLIRLAGVRPEGLEDVTGIKEHRLWEQGTTTVEAATMAGKRVLEASGIDRSRIGVIVNTSVSRDFYEPGVAVCVHSNLGLSPSCISFDITNACVGLLNGMAVVGQMIEAGVVEYGLLTCAEVVQDLQEKTIQRLRRTIFKETYRDQMATLTIGCGAVAVLLCRADLAPAGKVHRLTAAVSRSASQCHPHCTATPEVMITRAKPMRAAVEALFSHTWEYAQEVLGWTVDNLDLVVPHQVGRKFSEAMSKLSGYPEDKMVATYPTYGNIGPAGIMVALSTAEKEGRLKPGMPVGLWGVGSGVNTFLVEVMW